MGEDTLTFISPTMYNDDKWHTIEATRIGKESVLKVDGEYIDTGICNGSTNDLQVRILLIILHLY